MKDAENFYEIYRKEPVIVEKTGRKAIVLISFEEYQRLIQIEDAYWAKKAGISEAGGYAGPGKSMAFLKGKYAEA